MQTPMEVLNFRLKCPDLYDFVEGLNDNQINIAIETALNLVFNPSVCQQFDTFMMQGEEDAGIWESMEEQLIQTAVQQMLALDAESVVLFPTMPYVETFPVFSGVNVPYDPDQLGTSADIENVAMMTIPALDFSVDKEAFYENVVVNLVGKLAMDVEVAQYSSEVMAMYNETAINPNIHLVSTYYKTPEDILHLGIYCTQ